MHSSKTRSTEILRDCIARVNHARVLISEVSVAICKTRQLVGETRNRLAVPLPEINGSAKIDRS
jgi:hypothetical protein